MNNYNYRIIIITLFTSYSIIFFKLSLDLIFKDRSQSHYYTINRIERLELIL